MKVKLTANVFRNGTFTLSLLSICCLLLFSISSCKKNKGTGGPPTDPTAPVISSVSPLKGPGLTQVTIMGSHFSTVLSENKVTINGKDALVIEATATKLVVLVPMGAGTGPVNVQIGSKITTGPDFEYEWVLVFNTFIGSDEGFADGTGRDAQFMLPRSIALTGAVDGSFYVTDEYNNRIRKVTPEGVVTTFAGSRAGYVNGPLSGARFTRPFSILAAPGGVFYIGELGGIRKISADGMVSTFVGDGTAGYADGQGAAAKFSAPSGLCMDTQGNLYCLDGGSGSAITFTPDGAGISCGVCIRKITPAGVVSTLAGSIIAGTESNGAYDYVDGPGTVARFSSSTVGNMIIDAEGNLLVPDTYNNCIRKITPDGMVSTYAGVKGSLSVVNGPLSAARFAYPGAIITDSQGNIYVSDWGVIRKISPAGIVTTYAGNGSRDIDAYSDGPVMTSGLGAPCGMAFSADEKTLYFSANMGYQEIGIFHGIRRILMQ